MGCQAPMSWAFSGTIRRNWVVIFQASTRISHRLLTSARRGANGKDATNRVTNPNWITVGMQQTKTHSDNSVQALAADWMIQMCVQNLTHLQVFIKQAELSDWLELIVLFPARNLFFWTHLGATTKYQILQPPRKKHGCLLIAVFICSMKELIISADDYQNSSRAKFIMMLMFIISSKWCHSLCETHGRRTSCMLFQTAFPVMMIDSCVVSSVRQPPGSHWTQ